MNDRDNHFKAGDLSAQKCVGVIQFPTTVGKETVTIDVCVDAEASEAQCNGLMTLLVNEVGLPLFDILSQVVSALYGPRATTLKFEFNKTTPRAQLSIQSLLAEPADEHQISTTKPGSLESQDIAGVHAAQFRAAEANGSDCQQPGQQPAEAPPGQAICTSCKRLLPDPSAYVIGGDQRCLRCLLQHGPLLRRSAFIALVVGTLLVAINQGAVLLSGTWPAELAWKIPLTYTVPFCVATWGAVANSRVS